MTFLLWSPMNGRHHGEEKSLPIFLSVEDAAFAARLQAVFPII
jgi:hypothetical protein